MHLRYMSSGQEISPHDFSDMDDSDEGLEPWSPWRLFIGLFLILIIILTIIPLRAIKQDPEPKNLPGLEIIPENITILDNSVIMFRKDYPRQLKPQDEVIKRIADKIVTQACDSAKICQAKALFYYVRDNFDYVSDPTTFEYVKSARESLVSKGGDCDDASVLLANLEQAIGIPTRFAFIPGHVYVEIYLPDAPAKYQKEGWIPVDPTCKFCRFGELSSSTKTKIPTYI